LGQSRWLSDILGVSASPVPPVVSLRRRDTTRWANRVFRRDAEKPEVFDETLNGAAINPPDQRINIIATAINAAITPPMITRCSGLPNMCRSKAKRVFSGANAMPQRGHFSGGSRRTSGCIGQM